MSVTQKEIAAKLNVAQSQVARALSGNSMVAAKTRERIQAAAREMGYDPFANSSALTMNAKRHGKPIRRGLIAALFRPKEFPNTGASMRSVPFYVPVFDGMDDEAEARGIDICLCPIRNADIPRLIRDKSVDGVILISHLQIKREDDLPKVYFHGPSANGPAVRPDDREGGRIATRHLLDLGHRRIAFLGMQTVSLPDSPDEQRLNGYLDAMREYGAPVNDNWIETRLGWPSCLPSADDPGCGHCACCTGWTRLMEKNGGWNKSAPPVTAVVCYNDFVAMGSVVQARESGVNVPHDLSVVGFDDVSFQYQFYPAITSVSLPRYEMGRQAVTLLQDLIEAGPGQREFAESVLPVSLVVRDSTQPSHN